MYPFHSTVLGNFHRSIRTYAVTPHYLLAFTWVSLHAHIRHIWAYYLLRPLLIFFVLFRSHFSSRPEHHCLTCLLMNSRGESRTRLNQAAVVVQGPSRLSISLLIMLLPGRWNCDEPCVYVDTCRWTLLIQHGLIQSRGKVLRHQLRRTDFTAPGTTYSRHIRIRAITWRLLPHKAHN